MVESRTRLADGPQEPLPLFTTSERRGHATELSGKVRQYMDQAGITKKGSCHLFRHATATLMLEGGVGPSAQQFGGSADESGESGDDRARILNSRLTSSRFCPLRTRGDVMSLPEAGRLL